MTNEKINQIKVGQQYWAANHTSKDDPVREIAFINSELVFLLKVLENGELCDDPKNIMIKYTSIVEKWVADKYIIYTGVTTKRDARFNPVIQL